MNNLLFLTFYYQPDLSAGSFRNTLLADILSERIADLDSGRELIIITTLPNRYSTYNAPAETYEKNGNRIIHRVDIGQHTGGFFSQSLAFYRYWKAVFKIQRQYDYDIIYASSSRLMTALLGASLKVNSKRKDKRLFLDIRDIFRESITDILSSRILKIILNGILKRIEQFIFSQADVINVVTPAMVEYFKVFNREVTCFSNGVDDIFFNYDFGKDDINSGEKIRITFAGNIGKAQALHKILPEFAKHYRDRVDILIIGDGSSKQDLLNCIQSSNLKNINVLPPISRQEVLQYYKKSDFLFLHLDDKRAFHKAIPSKLFEYAATTKPIIAGLKDEAKKFAKDNVHNALIFDSNDCSDLIKQFETFKPEFSARTSFLSQYRRKEILTQMSEKILCRP